MVQGAKCPGGESSRVRMVQGGESSRGETDKVAKRPDT